LVGVQGSLLADQRQHTTPVAALAIVNKEAAGGIEPFLELIPNEISDYHGSPPIPASASRARRLVKATASVWSFIT
jgi:hypothetical protein